MRCTTILKHLRSQLLLFVSPRRPLIIRRIQTLRRGRRTDNVPHRNKSPQPHNSKSSRLSQHKSLQLIYVSAPDDGVEWEVGYYGGDPGD